MYCIMGSQPKLNGCVQAPEIAPRHFSEMIFYGLHHLMHLDASFDPDKMEETNYNHGARNVRTFLFGSIAYIFLAAFLYSPMYQPLVNSFFFLSALRDWFSWFVLADLIAMAIIFKKYWGFSILWEAKEAVSTETRPVSVSFEDDGETLASNPRLDSQTVISAARSSSSRLS
jgi:hypothetical protein